MLKSYLALTKPGIIMGNGITALCGFALASHGFHFPYFLFGLSLIIASACVYNNVIDRYADQKMARTQNRALAIGLITLPNALTFATLLLLTGLLALSSTPLALLIALSGHLIYVLLYSLSKYKTHYATLIGSLAGAVPPLVGYAAVAPLDTTALLLFALVALWQMPHFYAIALYRSDDYAAASIPVLPLTRGIQTTKIHMLLYTLAFPLPTLLLLRHAHPLYLSLATLLTASWILLSLSGFRTADHKLWARHMFRASLLIITALSLLLPLAL